MPIQTDYSPNLLQSEIFKYARKDSAQKWSETLVPKSGFVESSEARKEDPDDPSKPKPRVPLFWSEREYYEVLEGPGAGEVVGNFDVVVPQHRNLIVTIQSALLLKSGISQGQKDAIEVAFRNYNPNTSGDPEEYVAQQLAANPQSVDRTMFAVVCAFYLEQAGPQVPHTEQKDAILAMFNMSGDGQVWPGPGLEPVKENTYLSKRTIRAKLLRTEILDEVPPPQVDPIHQVVSKDPSSAIDKIIEEESKGLECKGFEKKEFQVATLATYPEFMIVMRDFDFDIGCGIHIILRLPVLQIRWSALNLWAYARVPQDVGQLVVDVLVSCMWRAALSGAVIGVALGNFPLGLAAFKGIFSECVKEKFGQMIGCLIPGLAIISQVTEDWADVKL